MNVVIRLNAECTTAIMNEEIGWSVNVKWKMLFAI